MLVGVPSLFHPKTPGDITNELAPAFDVKTSAITPEPGAGSVPSVLLASLDLLVVSV